MTPAVIQAGRLIKRYGDYAAVNGVTVEVQAGECWGLLGPNGAGKTTLLRLLIGNTPPSAGHLQVPGYPIPGRAAGNHHESRADTGYRSATGPDPPLYRIPITL